MLQIPFLKRLFPNAPDWLIGGLFFVGLFWLVVLSIQLVATLVKQEPLASFLSWFAASFYIWGYVLLPSSINSSYYNNSAPEIVILVLSILFASPIYFIIGALFAMRKSIAFALGVLLAVVNIVSGCLLMLFRLALTG